MNRENVGGIFLIARKSLAQHRLSTVITVLSVALAAGLVMAVFSIRDQTYDAFTGGPTGFDAVLGARGSQLQLVLNTVFHLETSPGNIPWEMYEAIKENPNVELAVPYAVGDNYRGYRIVGTERSLFTDLEYRKGRKFTLAEGEFFNPEKREAVVGSYVADKTGLRAGSKFNPFHGLVFDERQKHAEEYTVTGVLEPTNSPSDRVIWIPIDEFYRISGHVLRGGGGTYEPRAGEEIPDRYKEVSAVMLKLRNPQGGFLLDQTINRQGTAATLAWPIGRVMAELFGKIGWVNNVLSLVAYLVVLVAAGSILASIYNTMNERRREFAILRALGARRGTVFAAIILESASIAAIGAALGCAVYALILAGAAVVIRAETGVVLDVLKPGPALLAAPLAMIALGILAGVIPALKAYSTDVASNLAPLS
ncbi:MAG TPA: ABC transporter permease [Thermodesulfobacteriota bacterium]|nr:ABC transporter permease [Thermodesulfobacteriota bacterium]